MDGIVIIQLTKLSFAQSYVTRLIKCCRHGIYVLVFVVHVIIIIIIIIIIIKIIIIKKNNDNKNNNNNNNYNNNNNNNNYNNIIITHSERTLFDLKARA